ncbi:MAG: DinB family protein [Chitinophagaceae bacterium]
MDIKATSTEADQTFTDLLQTLSSIEDLKINTIPFDGSWTPGQLAQHIILSAGGFVQLLNGPVKDTERDSEANIPNLKTTFLNFTIKMKSPDFIVPEEKDYDKRQLVGTLQDIKVGLVKAIETLDTTKTCTAFELPVLGYLTRAEAIIFTIVHTQRHAHQLKNIRQHLTEDNV